MTERVFRSSPALRANYRAVRVRRRIRAAMQAPGRGTFSVVRARQIAALALLQTGSSRKTVGVMLHRSASGAHALVDRALSQPALVAEARAVVIAARGAVAGDVVLVPIVVGSAAWCHLDKMAELDEISAVVIRQRIGRSVIDRAVGAEC